MIPKKPSKFKDFLIEKLQIEKRWGRCKVLGVPKPTFEFLENDGVITGKEGHRIPIPHVQLK